MCAMPSTVSQNITSDRSFWSMLLRQYLPVALIIVVGAVLLLISEVENETTRVEGEERSAIRVSTSSIRKTVQTIVQDVRW